VKAPVTQSALMQQARSFKNKLLHNHQRNSKNKPHEKTLSIPVLVSTNHALSRNEFALNRMHLTMSTLRVM